MLLSRKKISMILTLLILLFASIASLSGILLEDLYKDNEFVNRVWKGNDLITLFFAIPLLFLSLFLSWKGSLKGEFLRIGSLWFMVYNYIFYMYGAAFNSFFLIHTLIFILSAYSLILALMDLNYDLISENLKDSPLPFKRISLYMLFFGLFIGGMWITQSVSFISSGVIPSGIVQTGHTTGVVFATDLSFLVSTLFLGAVLLRQKKTWGFIISAMLMVKCILYPLVLVAGGILAYQVSGLWDAFTPFYVALGAGCLFCLLSLLKGLNSGINE